MAYINENYLKLAGNYLFAEVDRRRQAYVKANPQAKLISLGIGDVTLPLPTVCLDAMIKAVKEMGDAKTFRGYGPYEGYEFLREAIAQTNYKSRQLPIDADEIFVSDGSKGDCANIQEIFSQDSVIAISDPVYPVYLDTNVMAGRTGTLQSDGHYQGVVYLPCLEKNQFAPSLPDENQKIDLIYLCCPNNPTGTTMSKEMLKKFVEYAKKNKAIILFDAAYAAYITEENVPHSIYEIEGAKDVAIEFRSFSKTAGFTGTRCGYTVIPKNLVCPAKDGSLHLLNQMWQRRQATKYNGTSYIIQRGAAAIYSDEGQAQIKEKVAYYMQNAKIIREGLQSVGIKFFGGTNAPYIWLKAPNEMKSWDFFDLLLTKINVVGTPGVGFGPCGEHYLRLTAFGNRENTETAIERITKYFK